MINKIREVVKRLKQEEESSEGEESSDSNKSSSEETVADYERVFKDHIR